MIVRVEDSAGHQFDETITVTVDDVNEAPTAITPNSFSIDENTDTTAGYSLGALGATDDDDGETFTYTIEGGIDEFSFSIGGTGFNELIIADGILDHELQDTYSVIVRVEDSAGHQFDETITVTVDDVNEAPTAITPNSFSIDENTDTTAGYSLGVLGATDDDDGETFTYSIEGGTDEFSFSIGGTGFNELILADGILDHESQDSYSVIVRVEDSAGHQFDETITVTVGDVNEAPTAITPNSFSIDENTDTTAGFSLGALAATDDDDGETFTYTIEGGIDEFSFSIGGTGFNELILADGMLDHESQDTYSVIVRVEDSAGHQFDETITVTVDDVNEAPTAITPNSFSIDENTDTTAGYSLGVLGAADDDDAETFTYSIEGGTDEFSFSIGGTGFNELILADGILDHESQDSYSVIVRVEDSAGHQFDETITVTVGDVNEAPTAITPNSFSIDENTDTTAGFSLGALAAADDDDAETFTYTIEGGADEFSFSIGGIGSDELIIADGILDHELQDTYTVIVRVEDSAGHQFDETISVTVDDVNESPTGVTPTTVNINENINTSGGYSLGLMAATDEDDGDSFSYTLSGGADVGLFSISGNELFIDTGIVNYESDSSYSVDVEVQDAGGNTFVETITVGINDQNDNPEIVTSTMSITESQNIVGTVAATDEDLPSDTLMFSIAGTGADDSQFAIDGTIRSA